MAKKMNRNVSLDLAFNLTEKVEDNIGEHAKLATSETRNEFHQHSLMRCLFVIRSFIFSEIKGEE